MHIITHVLTSPQSELREDTEEAAARREAARQNIGVKVTDVQNSAHESLVGEGGVVTIQDIAVDDALSTTSENPVQNKVVTAALEGKVDVESGKGLSSNDYTTAEKTKLSGIESGAQANIIESVKVDGTALSVDANKAVNIPLADGTATGVVTITVESGKVTEISGMPVGGSELPAPSANNVILLGDATGGKTWTALENDVVGTQLLGENGQPMLDETTQEPIYDAYSTDQLWTGFAGKKFGAARAVADQDGNVFGDTYATKNELANALGDIETLLAAI